jgi:hypothetical protein
MSRLGRIVSLILFPGVLPVRRRSTLAPHAIVLLLAAYAFVHADFPDDPARPASWRSWTWSGDSSATAECQVLGAYFARPELLADSGRTPEELNRWTVAYEERCR